MNIENVRSRSDFIEFLKGREDVSDKISNDDYGYVADRFIAMQEAKTVFDSFSQKDLADTFLEGLVGIKYNPDEYHENWWSSIWEEVDYAREEGDDIENSTADEMEKEQIETLEKMIQSYFGLQGE